MIIYKDVFTEDEICSDSFPMKLVDGVVYEFSGKYVVRKEGELKIEGFNASEDPDAEKEDDGTEENVQRGIDVVLNHNLQEMDLYSDLKSFKSYIKEFMKKTADYQLKNGVSQEDVDIWKKKMTAWVMRLMKKEVFDNLVFYVSEKVADGESEGGQVIICEYRDIDGEEKPIMMYVKAAVIEEKQ